MWSKITYRSLSRQVPLVLVKVLHQHLKWTFFLYFCVRKKMDVIFVLSWWARNFCLQLQWMQVKGMGGRTNVFHTCCCCRGWSWREVGVIIRKTHSVLKSNKSKSLEIVCTYLYWNYQRIRINNYFWRKALSSTFSKAVASSDSEVS